MPRVKLTCDHERPTCRRLATRRIIARKVSAPRTRHASQYCADCAELIRAEVPRGWEIVSDEPIQRLPCGCYWTAMLGRSPEHPHEAVSA